jgi:hypothetical protein
MRRARFGENAVCRTATAEGTAQKHYLKGAAPITG